MFIVILINNVILDIVTKMAIIVSVLTQLVEMVCYVHNHHVLAIIVAFLDCV
jgi:hypothetical protein